MSRHEYFLKAWWPQTEAANAMIMAFALSKDAYYLDFYRRIDRFAHERLRDPQDGEWFAYAPVGGRAFHDFAGSDFICHVDGKNPYMSVTVFHIVYSSRVMF
jgi:mannose/cellobiose epimerase-like protein (N-acyl-D-glucosamine 2-epimerase family)